VIELAASVQTREHDLGRGDTLFQVYVGRDAAPVVAHCDAAVAVQCQLDAGCEARLHLVHRVVDNLKGHVMQAGAIVGVADIHAWPAPDGIQTLQHRNRRGIIGIGACCRVRIGGRRGVVGHAGKRLHAVDWVL